MNTRKEILDDILISAQTNCVLKIKVKNAANPVITAVDGVKKNQIVLKPTCLYGYRLKKRNIKLPDIETVTRYKTHFDSPIFEKLRFIKDHFSEIRSNREAFQQEISRAKA